MTLTSSQTTNPLGTWVAHCSQNQPKLQLSSPTGELASYAQSSNLEVVYVGYIFNKPELQNLISAPVKSDAELLLRLYETFGESCIQKLKGVYSFGIWDQQQLWCARDRLGHFPLFYAYDSHSIFFSTTTQGLLSHPRVSAKLNPLSFAVHLSHRWFDNTQTFFQAIHRLPAGHSLRFSKGQISCQRYWNPVPQDGKIDWLGEESFEMFAQTFESTIQNYLTLGRPGMFLSGGLDSVSVAAVAADYCKVQGRALPLALSLGFEDLGVNEEVTQQGVAKQLGLSQIFLPFSEAVGQQGILQATLNLNPFLSAPTQNPWMGGYHSLGLMGQERGCDFVLTGGGGDEWLTVDPNYAHDLIKSLDFGGLLHLLQSVTHSYHLPLLAVIKNVLWTSGVRQILHRSLKKMVSSTSLKQPILKHQLRKIPSWIAPGKALRDPLELNVTELLNDRLHLKHDSTYLEAMDRSLNHPLMAMDMEEEFHRGKLLRMPMFSAFWNAELIELLYRVPPHLLNKGKKSKGMVRYTLSKRFPDFKFERQKKVVSVDFFRHTILNESATALKKLGGISALYDLGIVHPSQTEHLIHSIVSTKDVLQAYRLWDLLSLESWIRTHQGGDVR